MGYGGGGGGGGGGGSGGSGGSGGGGGYRTVGGGSAFGGSDEFELPSYNQAPAGSIRFNTDSKKLEVYILGPVGVTTLPNGIWMEVDSWSPDLQTGGARGVFLEGQVPGNNNTAGIDYINIASTGNAQDFGTLTVSGGGGSQPMSDRTRAVFSGGFPASAEIGFVTIASTGNETDWGANLTRNSYLGMAISNSTRGVQAGSYSAPNHTAMDYITIQSAGTVAEFGDLTTGTSHGASVMSSTRGIFAGGYRAPSGDTRTDTMQYVTTSTLGNTADFGNLSAASQNNAGNCNSTRGVIAIGTISSGQTSVNTIEYITMSTLGNTQDFGDSANAATHQGGGCCSSTRGVLVGGYIAPLYKNFMEYVQIMSTGNAIDFGDLATNSINAVGCSNGHGGL